MGAGSSDCAIAVVGGGPAGLAVAIRAARAGHQVLVLERADGVVDKACGEGLMPQGVRALEALGVRRSLPKEMQRVFTGIRYALEDGRSVEGRFRHGDGLGVRRVALSSALRAGALGAGARIEHARVQSHRVEADRVLLETDRGQVRAQLLIGADGLQSPLRRAAGLELPVAAAEREQRRYGLRRHFACAPWSNLVEVHWLAGGECYVTPVGPNLVNVAFLWSPRAGAFAVGASTFEAMLARFPAVQARLGDAQAVSESRGSGPLFRPARGRAGSRLALVGDAAGYVDAITGQGLSLAFAGAEALVDSLPANLADAAALSGALHAYDRSLRSAWRRYAWPASALLALARRPRVRRAALGLAARFPSVFAAIVEAIG